MSCARIARFDAGPGIKYAVFATPYIPSVLSETMDWKERVRTTLSSSRSSSSSRVAPSPRVPRRLRLLLLLRLKLAISPSGALASGNTLASPPSSSSLLPSFSASSLSDSSNAGLDARLGLVELKLRDLKFGFRFALGSDIDAEEAKFAAEMSPEPARTLACRRSSHARMLRLVASEGEVPMR